MKDPAAEFKNLVAIVDALLAENGCPWDKAQTRESLKPYLIEEAYEALEALDSNRPQHIQEELGDLLFQILFHAKIAAMRGEFGVADVIADLSAKMVRRHPHVFGEGSLHTPEQVLRQWEEIKKEEKKAREEHSALAGVPLHLPGLARAQQLQKRAAKCGFDWDKIEDVVAKLDEEILEFKEAILTGKHEDIEDELGDIFFVLVNIARFKKVNAEEALRATNEKFRRRFQYMEKRAAEKSQALNKLPLAEQEALWQEAKTRE